VKTFKVVFSRGATKDLDEILIYLAPRMGVSGALAYSERIRVYCLGLASFPKRGTQRSEVRSGLRLVGYHRKATVAFVVTDDTVMILRIFARGRAIDFRENDDDPG
jgi:toxin ParE1/3/4